MKNNDLKQDRDEIIFEALLKAAAKEIHKNKMDALPTEEEFQEMFADTGVLERLDKQINAMVNKKYRESRIKQVLLAFSRIATIFCVLLVLSTGIIMANPTSRNFILSYLIDVRDDHVVIDFGMTPMNGSEIIATAFPYVPEGFRLVRTMSHDNLITYAFENDEGYIIIMQRFLGHSLRAGVDNEYAHFSEVQLSGGAAHIFVALYEQGLSTIMWRHGNDVISIATTLEADVLILLAETYMEKGD